MSRIKSIRGEKNDFLPPIAIIGLAGILPEAENLNRYWENILNEVNCIREVPPSRWKIDDYYDPDPSAPDKTYSKYGGFIPDISFDPMEFGLPPNILEVTDVSQLLSLIVAKDALGDAGYAEAKPDLLDRTGVILGMVGMSSKLIHPLLNRLQYPVWEKVLKTSSIPESEIPAVIEKMKLAYVAWNENAFPGSIGNVVAGRIANRLDLGGTNCIVDAACGSSLAAVSMAISELAMGRADMMITGGVDTDNSILTYLCFSKTPAFSKGDRLRAFSADSDGMLAGEGIGMLVLKRLEDAQRDQDRIYAVIRGVGTSSDGHFKSIYAPRAGGQAKALRRAYAASGYSPASVELIEAHGTGTNAGDPAEFEGLREVFGENNSHKQYIALGSVKSQIGHTKATAGAASLIKTSLAIHHKVLPATINISRPNSDLGVENTPFYLNSETRPWFKNTQGTPRRAGVSSFGFGGTNFHIALEEYSPEQDIAYRIHHVPYSILLFATTPEQLLLKCQEMLAKLEGENSDDLLHQVDLEAGNSEIPSEYARVGFIAESINDACEKLRDGIKMFTANINQDTWVHPKGIFYRKLGMDPKGKTVALFPGQGSQYINMGKELAINYPPFRKTFEKTNEIMAADGRDPLTNIIYPIPVFSDEEKQKQSEILTKTENAQPAIGTFSLALYKLLTDAGFQADFFAGHSYGELVALWASDVYGDEALIRLSKARGEAMSLPVSSDRDPGTMIAVKGDVEKIQNLLKGHNEVTIANLNSPTQVVLGGATNAIQAITPELKGEGLAVYPLQVSTAFHTSFVKHAQAPFKQALQKETFKEPKGVVFSNSTAHAYDKDPVKISELLGEHILNQVKFKEEIENIYADGGSIFIEIGPKNVLTSLVKDILKDKPHETIALNPNAKVNSDFQFRQAILQMRVLGMKLGNVDPFGKRQAAAQPPKQSKVAVILNGGLYTTEKTRSEFEKALQEKPAVMKSAVQKNNGQGQKTLNQSTGLNPQEILDFPSTPKITNMKNNQHIETLLERFQEQQNGFLQAHAQFLQNDHTSKQVIQELTQAELALISKMNGNPRSANEDQAFSMMEKKAVFINSQHTQTSAAHLEYIKSQTVFSQQYAALIKELIHLDGDNNHQIENQKVVMPKITPVEVQAPAQMKEPNPESFSPKPEKTVLHPETTVVKSHDAKEITQAFLQIVSEKTGYPTDMLQLNMDMEADLGIDSIKRVEILGALQEKFPNLPAIDAEKLVSLRTLEQIISAYGSTAQAAAQIELEKQEIASEPILSKVIDLTVKPVSDSNIQAAFLEIMSEKTGYPADMLELSMDMEADLGIDSIKRVEILGAMQERFPQLPTIAAEELSALRTVEQIIENFNASSKAEAVIEASPLVSLVDENIPSNPAHIERYQVKTKRLPQPDYLEFKFPEDGLVLITDDGTGKSEMLANFYREQNLKVGLVYFKAASNQAAKYSGDGTLRIHFSETDEGEIQNKMEALIAEYKKISAFIHVHPPCSGNRNDLLGTSDVEAAILKSVFLIARQLKTPLTAAGGNTRPAFITVSQMDGQFGLSGNSSIDPLAGGLTGLTKTLRLEWNHVFCRALDFHPDIDPQTIVKLIDAELHDPNLNLTEVGYTLDGRYTLSLEQES